MMSAAAARRGANGGGWLHAAWMALTGGATPAELLMEEEVAGGGGSSLPVLTVRNSSRYELVSTEEPDGDGTSWEASQLASEAELFLLAREGDPKTTTRSSPESIFACDELRMSKPEFWRLSGKKAIAGDGEPGSKAAVAESEPFLTRRRRGAKWVNDVEMEGHPFSFGHQGRLDSSSSPFLLLSSS